MPRPPHLPWLDLPNDICDEYKIWSTSYLLLIASTKLKLISEKALCFFTNYTTVTECFCRYIKQNHVIYWSYHWSVIIVWEMVHKNWIIYFSIKIFYCQSVVKCGKSHVLVLLLLKYCHWLKLFGFSLHNYKIKISSLCSFCLVTSHNHYQPRVP
jgi:hypothetical protein